MVVEGNDISSQMLPELLMLMLNRPLPPCSISMEPCGAVSSMPWTTLSAISRMKEFSTPSFSFNMDSEGR